MPWGNGLVDWTEGNKAFVSVVFSWMLQQAYSRCVWYKQSGYEVFAGGPAVVTNPGVLDDVAEIGGSINALPHHNGDATYTTRGCVRSCSFCAVPRIEGKLIELDDDQWTPKKIICDNNLLASCVSHFDHVIDRLLLSGIKGIDFNGGLDSRLLTDYHAQRLSELPGAIFHTAWDNVKLENEFMSCFTKLRNAGIGARRIRVYVLIGYNDNPQDALYRLQKIKDLGATPNPMRYQPLNAKKRNEYVGKDWTELELKRFMRYWARQSYFRGIPFEEYKPQKSKR